LVSLNRIRAGLYGVAIGDALGATLEFMDKQQIKQKYSQLRDIVGGGWLSLKPGEWTDDTEMTIAVAQGILENPYYPVTHIGDNFLSWLQTNPPDVGNTINATYQKYLTLNNWHEAAKAVHNEMRTAGNGALMRTLPVALMYKDPADIYMISMYIARMTHWDSEAGLTCFFYCLLARQFLNGIRDKKEAWKNASDLFFTIIREEFVIAGYFLLRDKLDDIESWPEDRLKPSGYTVDTLACALWCFYKGENFEETVIKAVNLGGDADTIGAVTGGLAGVYWGYEGIPKRWLAKFSEEQTEVLDKLAESMNKVTVLIDFRK